MARQRYQKGSVFLRGKAQVWIGRWREDVMNAAGETRRVKRSDVLGTKTELPTAKLAQRRLDLTLARINAPSYRPGRMATVEEFAERWKDVVLVNHKPSSQHVAKIHLRRYIVPRLGKLRLDQLGQEVQQGFVSELAQICSRKYALNILGTLGSMLRTAETWGYTTETVSMRRLSMPQAEVRREARFFSAAQVQQILAAASGMERLLYMVAVMTGLRPGELLGLQRGDLDFERRLIHVRRSVWEQKAQTPKSKGSARPVPMPEVLVEPLSEHLKQRAMDAEAWLFVNQRRKPIHAEHFVQRRLRPLLDRLGIPRCGLHAFRHTHCSMLVDSGAPAKVVQDQMRHADVRTTLGVYAHAAVHAQREAVEKVAAIVAPTGPKVETVGQWIH